MPPTLAAKPKPSRPSLALIAAAVVVLWFAMLYPLTPSSVSGFMVEALSGFFVFLFGWVSVSAISGLKSATRWPLLSRTIAVAVACMLGVVIFGAAYWGREFMLNNFSYFFR